MTVLSAIFQRGSAEDATRPLTDATLLDTLGGELTASGLRITPETAFRLSVVYRCVALLAGIIGALPLHASRRGADGRRVPVDSPIVSNPHPDMTVFEVMEFVGQSLLSHGNAYLLKHRDGLGRVRELHPVHAATVRVDRKRSYRTAANPTGKRFYVTWPGEGQRWYTPHELLHIPGLSYDGLVGLSPLGLARQGIGLGLAAERFGAEMFDRGALVQGVLETDKEIDRDDAKALKHEWRTKTSGHSNHWSIPVLDKGVSFKAIALPPADVQYLEARKFSVSDVARFYGLPPHLVGDVERSTSWGTGIEQQNMQMLTFTADPWLVRIEQRWTREVIGDGSTYMKFNRKALLRADTAARFLAYQRAVNNGWMSPDEVRELEEQEPLPDGAGNVFFRPQNHVPFAGTSDPDEGDQTDDD